jgi:hypothetical protein
MESAARFPPIVGVCVAYVCTFGPGLMVMIGMAMVMAMAMAMAMEIVLLMVIKVPEDLRQEGWLRQR